jgi:squalene cyclase
MLQGDGSNTQYAMLALHEADLAGATTSEKIWQRALDHLLSEQREDGSWGYYLGMDGSGSMTCAGAACTSIASQHVKDKSKVAAAQASVKRAEKWLTKHFSVHANPQSTGATNGLWHYCYLYDLERAGRLAGWSKVGDHDWREEGVRMLLHSQRDDGAWKGSGFAEMDPVISTSLALLFLRPESSEKPLAGGK